MDMSPASRSKSKGKMVSKEHPKSILNTSIHPNTSGKSPSNGYDSHLGQLHTFETAPSQKYGCSKNMGAMKNLEGNSFKAIEYDSVSNNGSFSCESVEHKEGSSQVQSFRESLPRADDEKREKLRRKNEKKHQRQRARRAQELHERCSSYLISRKLEALTQELVNMGFSQEHATLALILNEGRIEESVSWLFEACAEGNPVENDYLNDVECNLKVDISGELARIAHMETRYKVSKQEIERIVVTCEGDLDEVEHILKMHLKEPSNFTPEPEQRNDSLTTVGPSTDPWLKNSLEPENMQPKLELAKAKAERPQSCSPAVEKAPKTLQRELVNEPMVLMQHPCYPKLTRSSRFSSSSPGMAMALCSNNIGTENTHKLLPPADFSRSFGFSGVSLTQSFDQCNRQTQKQLMCSNSSTDTQMITKGNRSPYEYLSVTQGSKGSSTSRFDYKKIDWSLDLESLISESGGSLQNNAHSYGLYAYRLGMKFTKKLPYAVNESTSTGTFKEWSSPFEEKDLFSLQKLFLSFPSM